MQRSVSSADPRIQQIDRVVNSTVLQTSEALCTLLRFLAEHSIASPDVPVKEFQIATEVLGRSANFDPRLDSAVRVQTSRLRSKLGEYYNTIGREDPIVVEIPKGGHAVIFTEREPARVQGLAPDASAIAMPADSRRGFSWKWLGAGAGVLLILAAIAMASGMWNRAGKTAGAASTKAPAAVQRFWGAFLQGTEEPLVVFSNAEFVGRPETGLRYFNPQSDHADAVFDHYTGVGEVLSVHQLDETFAQLGRGLHVKRGRLLNWDDVKGRDVIFLGSPNENLSLRELSLGQEFRFQTIAEGPRAGDLGIVNLHPAGGEQPSYVGSKGLPTTEDYALVELSAGGGSARSVLMLAGTTTFGTEAAVEFVCDEGHVAQLVQKLAVSDGKIAPFTALLHVKVQRGVPVETSLVAVRAGAK